jgi:hypothetical protein
MISRKIVKFIRDLQKVSKNGYHGICQKEFYKNTSLDLMNQLIMW